MVSRTKHEPALGSDPVMESVRLGPGAEDRGDPDAQVLYSAYDLVHPPSPNVPDEMPKKRIGGAVKKAGSGSCLDEMRQYLVCQETRGGTESLCQTQLSTFVTCRNTRDAAIRKEVCAWETERGSALGLADSREETKKILGYFRDSKATGLAAWEQAGGNNPPDPSQDADERNGSIRARNYLVQSLKDLKNRRLCFIAGHAQGVAERKAKAKVAEQQEAVPVTEAGDKK